MTKSLHTPEYDYFRSVLILEREQNGLTQAEISKRIGRPQSYVAKYEGGERRLDVIEFLEICHALAVDPHIILSKVQKGVGR